MTEIVALIVGIEHYAEPGWDVPGPFRNAIRIAQHLIAIGANPHNIHLFANQSKDNAGVHVNRAEFDALTDQGVDTHDNFTRDLIDTRFRELSSLRGGFQLLFYWSGHGYVDNNGDRIFICPDYRPQSFANRVFNASRRFDWLHSDDFVGLSEQILVADVCAKHTTLAIENDQIGAVRRNATIRQIGLFATPEGQYAYVDDGSGIFTDLVLGELAKFNGWPDLKAFYDAVTTAARAVKGSMFVISGFEQFGRLQETRVGSVSEDESLIRSLYDTLETLPLGQADIRRHYVLTAANVGESALLKAQDTLGMLQELTQLHDGVLRNGRSAGLEQFLMRIARQPNTNGIIQQWLAQNPEPRLNSARESINRLLTEEGRRKLLVVDLKERNGEPCEFDAFVCLSDQTRLPKACEQPQEARGWQEFCARLRAVLDDLKRSDVEPSEIHFFVEPPLLDLPFNLIERQPGGDLLGHEAVVLLHCRRHRSFRKFWEDYANALRGCGVNEIRLIDIPLDPDRRSAALRDKGLCYASFVFSSPTGSRAVPTDEQKIILQVLRSGVPYVCWLRCAPQAANWQLGLEAQLGNMLRQQQSLGKLPEAILLERTRGDKVANDITMLWDDPDFDPFFKLSGLDHA
jgi:hypothetical protein